jgi:hypothetical protein
VVQERTPVSVAMEKSPLVARCRSPFFTRSALSFPAPDSYRYAFGPVDHGQQQDTVTRRAAGRRR